MTSKKVNLNLDDYENQIEFWHTEYEGDLPLHKYLGLSIDDYSSMCGLRSPKKEQAIKSKLVIARINSAVNAGVKIKTIADHSAITYFRIASVVNTKSYRTCTKFTDAEAADINRILDIIKEAL